jgi:hypothetical protein
MAAMPRALLSAFVCLSLLPGPAMAATGPGPDPDEGPVEGPRPKPDTPSEQPSEPEPKSEPDLTPVLIPGEEAPGIEFAVPPPESEEPEPQPQQHSLAEQFPDPGIAPSDGVNMLVLGGTTIALTIAAFSAGLTIGLQEQVDLDWLLPSTIIPAVGVLAFAGGGLYLGIKRAREYRRWEIGYRVIGLPQGGGLLVGGSFALLGALGLIPAGVVLLNNNPDPAWGTTMIAVGAAAGVASPVMFIVGARNQRRYQKTGGWKRRPIPPLPPGGITGRVELRPMIMPLRGGASVGAGGRF